MQIISAIADLRNNLRSQKKIAFVPTMGNLHAGHIRLVEMAKQHADCVVVSIFVNPLQFGPDEDLESYPRTLEADCQKLKAAGADIVFNPSIKEMYSEFDGEALNQTMSISLPAIADTLCGTSRPNHFSGMATVVTKLFNIVQPSVAIFGKKDFQQLFIVRQLVRQFNLPIEMIGCETVRETSGLAMSSRNRYFSPQEKIQASQLHQALNDAVSAAKLKQDSFSEIEEKTKKQLEKQGWKVDYISILSSATLAPALINHEHLVILGAAKLGKTRLIDNIEFCAKPLN